MLRPVLVGIGCLMLIGLRQHPLTAPVVACLWAA